MTAKMLIVVTQFQIRILFLIYAYCIAVAFAYHNTGPNVLALQSPRGHVTWQRRHPTGLLRTQSLWMKERSGVERRNNNSAEMRKRGIYSRPSAAIEKGSGFYVPGLEGYRVRILVAILVLTLNYVNARYFSSDLSSTAAEVNAALETSQWLTSAFGTILFLQGMVEFRKEISSESDSPSEDRSKIRNKTKELDQTISSTLQGYGGDAVEAVRWSTASFVAMTPTTHMMLIQMKEDKRGNIQTEIIYRLGDFTLMNDKSQDMTLGITSAIKTGFESTGGRVAIGSTHPAAVHLLPEPFRRCVLLQRINHEADDDDDSVGTRYCLITGSDNILESYTKNDLKWLGHLAQYMGMNLHYN